jgi:hypothetical protein
VFVCGVGFRVWIPCTGQGSFLWRPPTVHNHDPHTHTHTHTHTCT